MGTCPGTEVCLSGACHAQTPCDPACDPATQCCVGGDCIPLGTCTAMCGQCVDGFCVSKCPEGECCANNTCVAECPGTDCCATLDSFTICFPPTLCEGFGGSCVGDVCVPD